MEEVFKKNKELKQKNQPGQFDLHKVQKDSEGKERYIKADEDEVLLKNKISQIGAEVALELKDSSFDARKEWIIKNKEEGNKLYKEKHIEQAIDIYLKCLCAFDFGKGLQKNQKLEIDLNLKIPVLNNLTLCLMQQKKFQRALQMIEQVQKIDQKNEKAKQRECQCYIEIGDLTKAEKILKELEDIAFQSQDSQNSYKQIEILRQKSKKYSKNEEEFSKKIFQNNNKSIYEDKPNAKTKEEQMKEEKELREQEIKMQKEQDILEEQEYLKSLTTIQWFIYPIFKFVERLFEMTVGCCKKEPQRIQKNRKQHDD